MITEKMIYWITRLDSVHSFCEGLLIPIVMLLIIGTLAMIVLFIISLDETEKEAIKAFKAVKKVYFYLWVLVLVISSIRMFVPTTNQMVAIYMIPQIAKNKDIQEIPSKATEFLNGKLDEWMNDMLQKKGEK